MLALPLEGRAEDRRNDLNTCGGHAVRGAPVGCLWIPGRRQETTTSADGTESEARLETESLIKYVGTVPHLRWHDGEPESTSQSHSRPSHLSGSTVTYPLTSASIHTTHADTFASNRTSPTGPRAFQAYPEGYPSAESSDVTATRRCPGHGIAPPPSPGRSRSTLEPYHPRLTLATYRVPPTRSQAFQN